MTISTYQSIFNIIGLLLSSVVAGVLIDRYGYKVMGVILGLISLFFLYFPVIAVREKGKQSGVTDLKFWASIGQIARNKNFLFYQISNLCLWFCINMLTIAVPFIGGVLMGLSETGSGLMLGGTFIIAIIASPFILKSTRIYGKKKVYSLLMVLFAFNLALLYLIGRPYLFFDSTWFAYLVVALAGVPVSGIFIIPNAIIADITDQDNYETGQKREAMFFGVQGLANKMMTGISSWVTLSILFNYFGYDRLNPTGIYLTSPLAVILAVISFFVFRYGYNLDEETVKSYRRDENE